MQFKIDETLHSDAADLLNQHGHDALTVGDQGLRGHADGDTASVCQQESRAIVTLDLDPECAYPDAVASFDFPNTPSLAATAASSSFAKRLTICRRVLTDVGDPLGRRVSPAVSSSIGRRRHCWS